MFRCPDCRTRRKDYGLFTQHLKSSGHRKCGCGGYPYVHRPCSRFCHKSPESVYHDAARRGESREVLHDIAIELMLDATFSTEQRRPVRVNQVELGELANCPF